MERTPPISCHDCGADFTVGRDSWECSRCARSGRSLLGIPDLRVFDDEYLGSADDWEIATRLAADFGRATFDKLLDRYFEFAPAARPDLQARQVEHIRIASTRANQWLELLGNVSSAPILDLGCGPGSLLAEFARRGLPCVGLDVALRWLVLARKRLDEAGFANVPLVCANAERMPFAAGAFSAIASGDVVEHVNDQDQTLAEAHRVLRPNGRIAFTSPNRFSLAPEPHVGIWGVGFLPRVLMPRYVQLMGGGDYRAIRNLGLFEWRRLLRASPFGAGEISAPTLARDEVAQFPSVKRAFARGYNAIASSRIGAIACASVGPMLQVVCVKADSAATNPSRRTPRRSKHRAA